MNRKRRRRPHLEALEDRRVLSALGTPWPDAQHLTISFAPDGTSNSSQASSLSRLMAPVDAAGGSWRLDILRAFQTWAASADINISVAGDSGAAFGTPGAIQGDGRFGDIRVGAVDQGSNVLALTQPFGYTAGSWAGDVNFNTRYSFSEGGRPGADLFSVALHEAGHALGLGDNSTDPTSVMYGDYSGARTGPSAADVADLRALYGARQADSYEGPSGNDTTASATTMVMITSNAQNASSTNALISADLTTATDKDFYKFTTSGNTGAFTVQLKTSGLSMLQGRLTLYDAAGKVVGTVVATDPTSGDLSIRVARPSQNATYYIGVQGATGDVFSVGSYLLRVVPDSVLTTLNPVFSAVQQVGGLLNVDAHTNDTFNRATQLNLQHAGVNDSTFRVTASLSDATDIDLYRLNSPSWSASAPRNVMTVAVSGLGFDPANARVTVYDGSKNPIAATLLSHEGGTYVVQVPGASPNTTYFIAVQTDQPINLLASTGNYELFVNFGPSAAATPTLGSGTLAPRADGTFSAPPAMTVTADTGGIFHFLLTADTGGSSQSAAVRMTVADGAGNVVRTLVVQAGQAQSAEVWLAPGTYTITIQGINQGIGTPSPLSWSLVGSALSDPILPYTYSGSGTSTPKK